MLLYLAAGLGLYWLLASGGPAGEECVDEGINDEAAFHLLALLNEPHTRAELDAAEILLTGYPKAQACVRAKRGSDE